MGASSSVLLNQVPQNKQEETRIRFLELVQNGMSEDDVCAVIMKEFQINLPQPPVEEPKESELVGTSLSVSSTTSNEMTPINKGKLSLIKKKARRSNSSNQEGYNQAATLDTTEGGAMQAEATTGQSDTKQENESSLSCAVPSLHSSTITNSKPKDTVSGSTSEPFLPFTTATAPSLTQEMDNITSSAPSSCAHMPKEVAAEPGSTPPTTTEEGFVAPGNIESRKDLSVSRKYLIGPPSTEPSDVPAAPAAVTSSTEALLVSREELVRRYGEVEFLLRSPLTSNAEIENAATAAKQGLAFIDDITQYSTEMDENRGMLLRWILPFDATTSISDQSNIESAGTFSGSGTGSAVSAEQQARFSAIIDEETRKSLLEGALALRKLVRVKLSDEADLKQGLASVTDTYSFLVALFTRAAHDGIEPFALLQTL